MFRTHSGNYTCTAINALTVESSKPGPVTRMGQAFTFIDVNFFHLSIEENVARVTFSVGDV